MKPFNETTLEFLNKYKNEINSFDSADEFVNWYFCNPDSRKFRNDFWNLDETERMKLILVFATFPNWGGPKNSIIFYYWTRSAGKNRCTINYEIYLGDPNTAYTSNVRTEGYSIYGRDNKYHGPLKRFPVSELNSLESIKKRLKEQIAYDIDSEMEYISKEKKYPQTFTEEIKDMFLTLIDEVNLIKISG